jgi:hypothetical protein
MGQVLVKKFKYKKKSILDLLTNFRVISSRHSCSLRPFLGPFLSIDTKMKELQ